MCMSVELMHKKKTHCSSFFILLQTNICDSAFVVATVMMVPRLKRRKEGSGSVVSLFPFRKTSTSTSIQQLIDDVLFEIFCRLPCESTAKCKSVSIKALAFSYFSSLLYSRLYSPPPPNQW